MVLLRGIELELHEDEDFSNAIRRDGDFYEADILDYLRDNFNKHDLIIDAGANIGNHTVYFLNFLKSNGIIAFEPWEENFNLLRKNAKSGNVIFLPYALSNKSGFLNFSPNRQNAGAGEINPEGNERVYAVTLDEALQFVENKVTLLKIDVEWHEPQLIEGAIETIEMDHPLILIEDSALSYHEILEPLGYKLYKEWPHHNTYLWKWSQ